MIEKIEDGEVTILRFCHGKANALDTEFLTAIAKTMAEVEASSAKACVLTGTGSIFSAGVDLKRLLAGGSAYLEEFMSALNQAFESLFSFSKPLIAACNGHAIAGGCVILSCCDLRFVAEGKAQIGVPELRVGVPFPLLALEIMRAAIPAHHIQEILYEGGTYSVDRALALGLCDQAVNGDDLLAFAVKKARRLAAYPEGVFAFNKELMRRPTFETLDQHGAKDAQRVLDLWASDAVQDAVREYVAKTLG